MSANGFPIPIATPFFATKGVLSDAWARYLKWLGDDGLQANNLQDIRSVAGAKYTLNANLCLLTFEAQTPLVLPQVIALPMRSLAAFKLQSSAGDTWYPSQTKSVTVPALAQFAQAWYIVDPRATKE